MSARRFWVLALTAGLVACSPSLNWRAVPVAQLVALLPCKPDHAERPVELSGRPQPLSMWGCEAGGALYAVSYMHLDTPTAAPQVIAAWQLAALRNLPGAVPHAMPYTPPVAAGQPIAPGLMVQASGKRADGQAVQAQLAWFSRGADVYHLAVYAPALTPALTDTFFTELHWQ